jgi:hypothetical protein
MSTRTVLTATAAALAAVLPAGVAGADGGHDSHVPRLEGRAVLPVATYAHGPESGHGVPVPPATEVTINGIHFPTPSQPVEGFSAIVDGRHSGEYLAMPDNGFGAKANSFDFNIRAYYIRPDFKTADGGRGTVKVGRFMEFSDPDGLIGFPIRNEGTRDRVLTGADIDPESLQRAPDGSFWVGDEFGPWVLHFDRKGRLLEAPIDLQGLMSPNNPHLNGAVPTVANSRGIEAMALSSSGQTLYVILEGAVAADGDPLARRVYEVDPRTRDVSLVAKYRTEVGANMVADAQSLDSEHLLLIERDAGRGVTALFRTVYEVDLDAVDAAGYLVKRPVVNLAAIPDPDLVSLPAIHDGDVGLGDPFRVTCESIEALHVISPQRLLLGCDNNLPNTGRNPALADDNEFITVRI